MARAKGPLPPEIAAKNRENGKLGGRPAAVLEAAAYKRLGPPPIDNPIALARWYTSALALVLDMRLRGAAGIDHLAKEVRATAAAAGKILPVDIIFAAKRALNDDDDDMGQDSGPEVEERIVAGAVLRGAQ